MLRNRLGIKSVREIERRESEALLAATEQMIDETRIDQCFTPDYVRRMHRVWLGQIYVWAGEYRQVNVAKGDFMFAAANQVPKLMHEFGRGPLRDYTPCRLDVEGELATALAGRCGRLLTILMGLQAGLPALDFGGIRGTKRNEYIAAVHAALGRDYAPMTKVFRSVIARTRKSAAKSSSD